MPSYKIIQSGEIIEVYEYQHNGWKDEDFIGREGGRKEKGEHGKEDRKMEYRESVNYKAREKIRRLINANFNDNNLFVTITFKENMQDIEKANYELKKYFQKLKRKQPDFQHVTVIEFQKRGAIHYHMLCNFNIEWVDHKGYDLGCGCKREKVNGKTITYSCEEVKYHERVLAKIWGNGFVDIKPIEHVDNIGAYMIKYLTKTGYDERLEGKKRYFFHVTVSNL